jgi:hypothetical protein
MPWVSALLTASGVDSGAALADAAYSATALAAAQKIVIVLVMVWFPVDKAAYQACRG